MKFFVIIYVAFIIEICRQLADLFSDLLLSNAPVLKNVVLMRFFSDLSHCWSYICSELYQVHNIVLYILRYINDLFQNILFLLSAILVYILFMYYIEVLVQIMWD